MEKYVTVCGFEVDFGEQGLGDGTGMLEENCGVEKMDVCGVKGVFDFD